MTTLIVSILIQVLMLVAVWMFFIKSVTKRSVLLTYYILVIGIGFLYEYFLLNYFDQNLASVQKFPESFRMLKGPLLFLYVISCIGRKIKVKAILFHFIPFIFFALFNILVLSSILFDDNLESKIVLSYASIFNSFYIYYWILYLITSIVYIFFFNKKGNNLEIFYTKILLVFILISVLSYYASSLFSWLNAEVMYVYYTYLFIVQFALILIIKLKTDNNAGVSISKSKYKDTKFSEKEYNTIIAEIENLIKKEELYLNEDLTLNEISQKTNIKRHHISEALNNFLNTNFYDYINTIRIKESIRLMKLDNSENITDLYFDSGFKSRSTFYKYFKKHTGTTPKKYKAQLQKQS